MMVFFTFKFSVLINKKTQLTFDNLFFSHSLLMCPISFLIMSRNTLIPNSQKRFSFAFIHKIFLSVLKEKQYKIPKIDYFFKRDWTFLAINVWNFVEVGGKEKFFLQGKDHCICRNLLFCLLNFDIQSP